MAALEGRRAVVTGSGRGIGRAVAKALAAEGAAVVVTARSENEITAVAEEIRAAGGTAVALRCDIGDVAAVEALAADSAEALGGPVDTLVNNAGVYTPARFMDYELADWERMLSVNVVATVSVTRAFLPAMIELDRSRLIIMASIAGKKGTFGQSAYNASKHAQIALTRCLAIEYGDTSLRVNAICPGFIMTDLIDIERLAAVHGADVESLWTTFEGASTIGRTVTVDEVAAIAVYLASPAADGMNGQSIAIDGGIVYS